MQNAQISSSFLQFCFSAINCSIYEQRLLMLSFFIVACSHIENKVAYVDPRLAFKEDERTNDGQVKQRFDASSTALQVLQGRDLTDHYVIVTGANSGIGVLCICTYFHL